MDPKTIKELSSNRRHHECLKASQQLLQSEPENPVPWKYAGKSLLALGQIKKAQKCLAKAHQLDTSDPEIATDIGNIFLNLGNKDTAAEWYEKSLKVNNNFAPAINNLANLKRQNGKNQEALDLFNRAIQVDPKLIQAYLGAAAALLALGDLDQAKAFAKQALAINESIPGINEILGIIYQKKKSSQQAVESYQKELAINPQSSTSLLNLGLLLLQQGKASAAIKPLATAAGINPGEQCSLLLAQAYQNIGNFKEAIAEYRKIDLRKTQNKTIPFNLGRCLLNTGSNIDAIEAFKLAIKLDESFLPAWGNIGTALMNEGRHQEALPVTQKVLQLDPDNPTAHLNLGGIYKNLGNLDQALRSTLKSLELKPDNSTALINLGSIYKDLGNLDQALAATLKSLALKPDNPDALLNLGDIYKDLGSLDQALAATLKSLKLKPDNPDALLNLGDIYKDLGSLDQALAVTLKSIELKIDNANAYLQKGIINIYLGKLESAEQSLEKSIAIEKKKKYSRMYLGLIKYIGGNYFLAEKYIKEELALEPDHHLCKMFEKLIEEKARVKSLREQKDLKARRSNISFPIVSSHPVEPGLIGALYELETVNLSNNLKRNSRGNAKTSNFKFFEENQTLCHNLEIELTNLAERVVGGKIYIQNSWFTILKNGGRVRKHNHLINLSRIAGLDIAEHQFALVYYLEVGDQACSQPGILRFYEPDKDLLPFNGMVTIFPSSRYHSVDYNGYKDRVMIAINFWSI